MVASYGSSGIILIWADRNIDSDIFQLGTHILWLHRLCKVYCDVYPVYAFTQNLRSNNEYFRTLYQIIQESSKFRPIVARLKAYIIGFPA